MGLLNFLEHSRKIRKVQKKKIPKNSPTFDTNSRKLKNVTNFLENIVRKFSEQIFEKIKTLKKLTFIELCNRFSQSKMYQDLKNVF